MNGKELKGNVIIVRIDVDETQIREEEVAVYVGNVPFETNWKVLRDILAPMGAPM